MIPKLSIFNLNPSTLKAKLQKSGITNQTLKTNKNCEINFYINKNDSTDYYILFNQTLDTNYFSDFINYPIFNYEMDINSIIKYIQTELQQRYTMGNKEYEFYMMKIIYKKQAEKLRNDNKILNEIINNNIEITQLKQKINDNLELQLKRIKTKNAKLEHDNKLINIKLQRLQSILLNIQSIAV